MSRADGPQADGHHDPQRKADHDRRPPAEDHGGGGADEERDVPHSFDPLGGHPSTGLPEPVGSGRPDDQQHQAPQPTDGHEGVEEAHRP